MKHAEIRISCKGTYDAGFVVSISNDAFVLAWATPDGHYSGVQYIFHMGSHLKPFLPTNLLF